MFFHSSWEVGYELKARQGRLLCFIPHQKIEQQWKQTVTSPNLPHWVISVSLILWMLSVHKTQSFVKWSLDLWNMRNTCVMVREVILLSEALYTTLRRAEIWWGVIDIRWTKWEQAKMLTDPSLSTQFFSGFTLSEKPHLRLSCSP